MPLDPSNAPDVASLFQDWAVAFLDIQGQQDKLARLTRVPRDEASRPELINQLQQTVGLLTDLRGTMTRILTTMAKGYPTELQKRAEFAGWREQEFEFVGFSDCVVTSTSVKPDPSFGYFKGVMAIYSMLDALAFTHLRGLAIGAPVRGGFDVEGGVRVAPGEIYGPALSNAYRLESKHAGYPRVLVGQGLLDYLDDAEDRLDSAPETYRKPLAIYLLFCREMIVPAPDDGKPMVDFLVPKWRAEGQVRPAILEMAQGARSFVETEVARFRGAGNPELQAKYERLLAYFQWRGCEMISKARFTQPFWPRRRP